MQKNTYINECKDYEQKLLQIMLKRHKMQHKCKQKKTRQSPDKKLEVNYVSTKCSICQAYLISFIHPENFKKLINIPNP